MATWRFGLATLVIAAATVLPVAGAAPASADTRLVDCGMGRRLSTALRVPVGRPLTIIVRGTCSEHVMINRDDVTLQAGSTGAGVRGVDTNIDAIVVDGARNVVIDGLVVTNGRNGIAGQNGAVFTVKNKALVQANLQNGIVATRGSTLFVDDVDVKDNGRVGTVDGVQALGQTGITVADNSTATVTNSRISGNRTNGIGITRSSAARIGVTTSMQPGPNLIENNPSNGISVYHTSIAMIDGNTIRNNNRGINVNGSSATITNNTVQQNATGVQITNGSGALIGHTDFAGAAPNVIKSNTSNGVTVSDGANASLYGNTIQLNGGAGVNVDGASARSYSNNLIDQNTSHGVSLTRARFVQGRFGFPAAVQPGFTTTPNRDVIKNNGTDANRASGINLFDGAAAQVDDAELTGNKGNGISADTGSTMSIRTSTISSNGRHGVVATIGSTVSANGPLTIQGNGVGGPSGSGFGILADASTIKLSGTLDASGVPSVTVRDNAFVGINLDNRSALSVTNALIAANQAAGIYAGNGSSVSMPAGVIIRDNGSPTQSSHGINAYSGATIQMNGARITGNLHSGISVGVRSSVIVNNTTISGNGTSSAGGAGIWAGGGSVVSVNDNSMIESNGTGGAAGTWNPGIGVSGGTTVELSNSRIAGHPGDGISVNNQSSLSTYGVTITGNGTVAGNGVWVGNGSTVQLGGNTVIASNGLAGTDSYGVNAYNDSTVEITDSSVLSHPRAGINLGSKSSLATRNAVIGSNGEWGVFANGGSGVTIGDGTRIESNGLDGIQAQNGVAVDVFGAVITANRRDGIKVNDNSTLNVGNTQITSNGLTGSNGNGITVWLGSLANLSGNVTVSGNRDSGLACNQSRYWGDLSGISNAATLPPSPCP